MQTLEDQAIRLAFEYMDAHPKQWDILRNRERVPFLLDPTIEVNLLMNDIDKYSGYMHSGASLALVMRTLERNVPRNVPRNSPEPEFPQTP